MQHTKKGAQDKEDEGAREDREKVRSILHLSSIYSKAHDVPTDQLTASSAPP